MKFKVLFFYFFQKSSSGYTLGYMYTMVSLDFERKVTPIVDCNKMFLNQLLGKQLDRYLLTIRT
jgi:hypothetical protein